MSFVTSTIFDLLETYCREGSKLNHVYLSSISEKVKSSLSPVEFCLIQCIRQKLFTTPLRERNDPASKYRRALAFTSWKSLCNFGAAWTVGVLDSFLKKKTKHTGEAELCH